MQSLAPSASMEAGGMLLRTLLQQQHKARALRLPCADRWLRDVPFSLELEAHPHTVPFAHDGRVCTLLYGSC
jgi:hypothetical protein